MNRDIRQKWVKRLMSRDVSQAVGKLRNLDGSMCVWGVLCDLYVQEFPDNAHWGKSEHSCSTVLYLGDREFVHTPPLDVLQWGELTLKAKIIHNGKRRTLMNLNDSGESFLVLADLIERNL